MIKAFFIFGWLMISVYGLGQSNSIKHNYWESKLDDSSGLLKMVRLRPIPSDSLNFTSIISFLNGKKSKKTGNNHIVFKKISNDTIYLKINNTTSLTQRMGTTGAMLFLAKITYNLTELNNIKYVNMDFEEGDHARPGTFSRKYFANE